MVSENGNQQPVFVKYVQINHDAGDRFNRIDARFGGGDFWWLS
jgi:hypothetical protein